MTDFLNSVPSERIILGTVYGDASRGTAGNALFLDAMVRLNMF